MALVMFTATHGVQLGDWAHFKRDEALDTPEGEKRYRFTTEDPQVAARLRKLKDYGIAEVK
jgi:nitrate reductase alpha subunit